MKAVFIEKEGLVERTVEVPKPGPQEVLVRLRAAALNRRDYWMTQGLYPRIQYGVVLGSDGCGEVVAVGDGVEKAWLHQSVVVNPSFYWGDNEEQSSPEFQILGMPLNGTLAEYICLPSHRIHLKPAYLSDLEAAAVPLAGLTAYRALVVKGKVGPGKKVLIPSIGSGVSQFAAQFAVAAGAEVWITTSSKEKLEIAQKKIKIKGGVSYLSDNWVKELVGKAGKFDVIVDGVGGENFSSLISHALNVGGKIVTYGATAGLPSTFPVHAVFLQHISVLGTTMGSDQDFQNMLKFITQHKVRPLIHQVYPLNQAIEAIKGMQEGNHLGKIVIAQTASKL